MKEPTCAAIRQRQRYATAPRARRCQRCCQRFRSEDSRHMLIIFFISLAFASCHYFIPRRRHYWLSPFFGWLSSLFSSHFASHFAFTTLG